MALIVFLRGGGDLASGVALRLHHAGLQIIIAELPQPLAVRRSVCFSEAIYQGQVSIEGVKARRVDSLPDALSVIAAGHIPVTIDPQARLLDEIKTTRSKALPSVLVDGRMTKKTPEYDLDIATLVIGLGPGFVAGENCHAVIETNRGHTLGRVIWRGAAQADTGVPGNVASQTAKRVLRSPKDGRLTCDLQIGQKLAAGQEIARVAGTPIRAPFAGVLRGMLPDGLQVWSGLKIGDVDPRGDPLYCELISEKSLAIGGGVLEAILSQQNLRPYLWD